MNNNNNGSAVDEKTIRANIEYYEGMASKADDAKKAAEKKRKTVDGWRDICDDIKDKLDHIRNGLYYMENDQYNKITNNCVKMTDPAQCVLDAMHMKDQTLLAGKGGHLDSAYDYLGVLKKSYERLYNKFDGEAKSAKSDYDYYMGLAKEEKKKL